MVIHIRLLYLFCINELFHAKEYRQLEAAEWLRGRYWNDSFSRYLRQNASSMTPKRSPIKCQLADVFSAPKMMMSETILCVR